MAKNRNKGFSLIEVIIGVAVLTILLTPVVKQLAQTMRTNRLAKEQQYANESATYALEYAQKTSFNELKIPGSSGNVYVTAAPTSKTRDCEILIYKDGNIDSIDNHASVAGLKVSYTSNTYKLNDVELGSRNTEYSRTLILDDLANKVSAFSFTDKTDSSKSLSLKVHYSRTGNEVLGDSFSDYTFTNEGSIVKYSTDDEGNTYISGIVCDIKDEVVANPNETLLGSMHDLVSTQVALVNGDATNYDKQAQSEYYAIALEYLRIHDPGKYDQIVGTMIPESGEAADSPFTGMYAKGLVKNTTIHIQKCAADSTGKPYYWIKVDVAYINSSVDVKLEYNAFSQRFYYDEKKDESDNLLWEATVPAVYIEYQPFADLVDGYAASENIFIDNQVDGAKIYLYQPAKDMLYADDNAIIDEAKVEDPTGEYKLTNASSKYVKININTVVNNDTKNKATYMYTNLDLRLKPSAADDTATEEQKTNYQFNTEDKIDIASTLYETADYDAFGAVNPTEVQSDKTSLYLRNLDEDTTTMDRLYTATVIVEPKTENVNTVTITGAKGGK